MRTHDRRMISLAGTSFWRKRTQSYQLSEGKKMQMSILKKMKTIRRRERKVQTAEKVMSGHAGSVESTFC